MYINVQYISKSFHLHLYAEKRGGETNSFLGFKGVCLKLVMRLTLKIVLQRMLVLWGFFFKSTERDSLWHRTKM